ncbi:MAG: 3-deoxy-manno-octulosonate cytidylyltransferase [Desulfovibrio sp.]|nr:3-deoxy-manno-octulosonate cytidylyltransferase [Desulfovibrio sp.]
MRIIAVIPARYSSTRLPGKPLLDILGKPMIVRVYEKAREATGLHDVVVATDDLRIKDAVEKAGGKAIMTSHDCESGSDRLLEVAKKISADVYINIQGDEPLLNPKAIDRLCACMQEEKAPVVATLAYPIPEEGAERVSDPNLVKVVFDAEGNALYFSRSPIPYVRDAGTHVTYYAHIGVYAYRKEALERFGALPQSSLEHIEKLEQLRLLQAGIPIRVLVTEAFGPGVDTKEDLDRVRALLAGNDLSESSPKKKISLIVTDVDGVLTDGSLFYGEEGEILKRFHAKDGLGIKIAQKNGLQIAVLSGRDCPALRRRMNDLGITVYRLGRLDKMTALQEILHDCGVSKEECAFLGDDVPDLAGFEGCAMGVCVADAHKDVLAKADLVLHSFGGQGALRELIDYLLEGK